MRVKWLIILGITLLLLPYVNVAGDPVLVWPDSDLLSREAAANLTAWFATSLDVPLDPFGNAEWKELNETGLPDFLLAREAFVLPLVDGRVEARYVEAGILRDVELLGNTSYFADSEDTEHLRAAADEIANDLGLSNTQPTILVERMTSSGWTSDWAFEGEQQDILYLEDRTDLGPSYLFNTMTVRFRLADLRVVSVTLHTWYSAAGAPEVTSSAAISTALDFAESEHNATDPLGTAAGVAVRNGTSFVYLVDVLWPASDGASWELDVWVDATTGKVVFEEGPYLSAQEGGVVLFDFPWMPVVLTITIALAVGLALFYRISQERALDHFTRGRIYGYIQANPGITYSKVRDTLDLRNGTLAYHLWVLERLGFVRSVRKGRVRQLYLRGMPVSKGSLVLSRLQYAILDLLKAKGPMTQVEIARHFKISRQRAHYNVKVLRSLSLLAMENGGQIELLKEGLEAVEKAGGES